MVLKLDIKKELSSRSDRVKCVDFHPTEPWLLVSLYNGQVHIWNYETQVMVKSFEICDMPTRTGKFIARKNWFIVGSDDLHLRVYNYNTHEKVHAFEAHNDYIRCVAVHPTQSLVLSCADDMLIKLWDWDKQWRNVQVFEGHSHYVMCIVFNPKDVNSFASASLDKTIKIWQLQNTSANYTLEGHDKGVNWIDYYPGGDRPYLVSAADDKLLKVWDYQNKQCVQTLEGHQQNVCVCLFHKELPIIVSGSEDGTLRLWNSSTYRLENTLNYGFERIWTVQSIKNHLAIGCDEGTIVIKLGREEPIVSMDTQTGKILMCRKNQIQLLFNNDVKDLGKSELYPQQLLHSPNGRFATVVGDGEYIIYTALSWRNKSYGQALEFTWSLDSNEYAVRESQQLIKVFRAFKERQQLKTDFPVDQMFGGQLLALRCPQFICFYDWDTLQLVRRIDCDARLVYWSDSGQLLCICTGNDSLFILKYSPNEQDQFIIQTEIDQIQIKSGRFIGDCFLFVSHPANRLCYLIGNQVMNICQFDKSTWLLGYLLQSQMVYLTDSDLNIHQHPLSLSLLECQMAVIRKDFNLFNELFRKLNSQNDCQKVSQFLESQGLLKLALETSTDPDHQFDLSLQLMDFDRLKQLASQLNSKQKWKQLAELSLQNYQFQLAQECLWESQDYDELFILLNSCNNYESMLRLAEVCSSNGHLNIAFNAYFLLQRPRECLQLLLDSKRFPEASIFSRYFIPSELVGCVDKWRSDLSSNGKDKIAQSLTDPLEFPHLFPEYSDSLLSEFNSNNNNNIKLNGNETVSELLSLLLVRNNSCVVSSTFTTTTTTNNNNGSGVVDVDLISDNMSHLSMEVNTTGTGSVKGDFSTGDPELDDILNN